MQKQQVNPIALEVKALAKKYKCLNSDSIRIIHEFCEYDIQRTGKVLSVMEQMKNPVTILQTLIKKPQRSEEILWQLQKKYDKTMNVELQMETMQQNEEMQIQKVAQLGFNFFKEIPKDCIMTVMSFLNPYQFFRFSITSKNHLQIGKSQAQTDYYKRLCTRLFKILPPTLPAICRFTKIREYVLMRPIQYRPNTRNAVQNNLRNFIWKMDMNSFNLQPSYYKQFGSYQKLFKQCPRVNFNGYYVLKDKYVRIGQKNQKNPVTPIHIIYYYRYLRFFTDGSVVYHVCNKKLKNDQIMTYLSKEPLENGGEPEVMIGEFIHYKNKVFVKAVQSHEVFGFQFNIRSTNNKISNELRIQKYTLQLIDDHQQIRQILFQAGPLVQKRIFNYCHNSQIADQNEGQIGANSL